MDPTKADAVAIRYDKIKAGPKDLIGTNPVMIFTEQGMTLAETSFSNSERRESPFQLHEIKNAIFIVDTSGSMSWPSTRNNDESRLEYVKRLLGKVSAELLPETNLCLIDFNKTISVTKFPSVHDANGLDKFKRKLEGLQIGSGTYFKGPLNAAIEELGEKDRSIIIFVTDGLNFDNKWEVRGLTEKVRSLNAGSFFLGVGSNYDMGNIIGLSSGTGYSGWAHVPMPGIENQVLDKLIKPFLREMQTCDSYLSVTAHGGVKRFVGLSPSFKWSQDNTVYLGYQQEGRALLFQDGESELFLNGGDNFKGDNFFRQKIEIVEARDAFSHYEKVEQGRNDFAKALVFMAQLLKEHQALEDMKLAYPTLRGIIDDFLDATGRSKKDEWAKQTVNEAMCQSGTVSSFELEKIDQHLHSGHLAPFDEPPPEEIPSMGQPNPEAYKNLNPQRIIEGQITYQQETFNLSTLWQNNEIVIGRSASCHFPINAAEVSRTHCRLTLDPNTHLVSIEDSRSSNGTYVNGERITEKTLLKDGDIIAIGPRQILFTYEK